MDMMKKGQVSVLIILGVIIAVIFVFMALFDLNKKPVNNQDNYEIFMSECIKTSLTNTLLKISDDIYLKNEQPILFSDKKIKFLGIDEIDKAIKNEMSIRINDCYKIYQEKNMDFELVINDNQKINIIYEKDKIILRLIQKVTIKKHDSIREFEGIDDIVLDVRFIPIIDSIEKILIDQENHPTSICTSCIAKIGEDNDVYIKIINKKEGELVLLVSDKKISVYNEEYYIKFIMRFNDE